MTNEERMEFVREKIQAMWRLNASLRLSEDDAVRAIVDRWEEDLNSEA